MNDHPLPPMCTIHRPLYGGNNYEVTWRGSNFKAVEEFVADVTPQYAEYNETWRAKVPLGLFPELRDWARKFFPNAEWTGAGTDSYEWTNARVKAGYDRAAAQREAERRRQEDQVRRRQDEFWRPPRSGYTAPPQPKPTTPRAILCVTDDAPREVIVAAYRALAVLHHPDHGGSEAKMKQLNAAYNELMK